MIPLQHPASSRFLTALVSNLVAGLLVILFLFTLDRFQARASLGELALVSEVSTGTAGTGKPQRGRGLKCVAEMMTWGSWKFSILRSKVVRISMAIEVVGFVWGLWPLPLLGFLLVFDWDVWGVLELSTLMKHLQSTIIILTVYIVSILYIINHHEPLHMI